MRRKKWRKKTHQSYHETMSSHNFEKLNNNNSSSSSISSSMDKITIPYTLHINNPLKYADSMEDIEIKTIQNADVDDDDDDGDGIAEKSLR